MFMQVIFMLFSIIHATTANGDDPIMSITCLGKYTGVFHSFIFYAKNETSTDYYCIRTAWLITYPERIRSELKKHGLTVLDSNPTDSCGWTTLAHIEQYATETGDIYKKAATIDELANIGSEILYNIYPSLEMALAILIPILVLGICIYIRIYLDRQTHYSHHYALLS